MLSGFRRYLQAHTIPILNNEVSGPLGELCLLPHIVDKGMSLDE